MSFVVLYCWVRKAGRFCYQLSVIWNTWVVLFCKWYKMISDQWSVISHFLFHLTLLFLGGRGLTPDLAKACLFKDITKMHGDQRFCCVHERSCAPWLCEPLVTWESGNQNFRVTESLKSLKERHQTCYQSTFTLTDSMYNFSIVRISTM